MYVSLVMNLIKEFLNTRETHKPPFSPFQKERPSTLSSVISRLGGVKNIRGVVISIHSVI